MTGRMMIRMVAVSLLMIVTSAVFSQKTFIYGRVVDENSRPFDPAVNIAVVGSTKGTTTRHDGSYHLDITPGKTVVVRYSFAGLKPVDKPVNLKAGDSLNWDLTTVTIDGDVVVTPSSAFSYNAADDIDSGFQWIRGGNMAFGGSPAGTWPCFCPTAGRPRRCCSCFLL